MCSFVFVTTITNPHLTYATTKQLNQTKQNQTKQNKTKPYFNRYARRPKFLLNILQCLRHQVHADVNKMVGNCSSTILCDVDMSPEGDADDGYTGITLKTA